MELVSSQPLDDFPAKPFGFAAQGCRGQI